MSSMEVMVSARSAAQHPPHRGARCIAWDCMDKGAIQGPPEYQDQAESRMSPCQKRQLRQDFTGDCLAQPIARKRETRFLTQRLELSRFAAPRVCEPLHQDQSDRVRIPANLLCA